MLFSNLIYHVLFKTECERKSHKNHVFTLYSKLFFTPFFSEFKYFHVLHKGKLKLGFKTT